MSQGTSGGKPVIHVHVQDDDRMRIIIELRRPRRRLFEAIVPEDVQPEELAGLVVEVQEIVRKRRRRVQ